MHLKCTIDRYSRHQLKITIDDENIDRSCILGASESYNTSVKETINSTNNPVYLAVKNNIPPAHATHECCCWG